MSKVLVVDDEVTLRDMITMVLEDAGHVVVTASNGAEALEVLARERAELVLMDIMMPVLDGRRHSFACARIPSWATCPSC